MYFCDDCIDSESIQLCCPENNIKASSTSSSTAEKILIAKK